MEVVTEEGLIKPARMRRRRTAATRRFLNFSSREARRQTWTPPFLQVMEYMVPSVLALAALKNQGKADQSLLFVENPIPVWCFLASTCVYWLIVGTVTITIFSEYRQMMLWRVAFASALLSAISLVSFFLSYHVSLSLLAIWAPLPVVLAWPILKDGYKLFQPAGVKNIIDKIRTKVAWVRGCKGESMPV